MHRQPPVSGCRSYCECVSSFTGEEREECDYCCKVDWGGLTAMCSAGFSCETCIGLSEGEFVCSWSFSKFKAGEQACLPYELGSGYYPAVDAVHPMGGFPGGGSPHSWI